MQGGAPTAVAARAGGADGGFAKRAAGDCVGDYTLLKKIGKGSFAVVWKAQHARTGEFVAIKDVDMSKLTDKLLENLDMEISIMRSLSHCNIARLIDHMVRVSLERACRPRSAPWQARACTSARQCQ